VWKGGIGSVLLQKFYLSIHPQITFVRKLILIITKMHISR